MGGVLLRAPGDKKNSFKKRTEEIGNTIQHVSTGTVPNGRLGGLVGERIVEQHSLTGAGGDNHRHHRRKEEGKQLEGGDEQNFNSRALVQKGGKHPDESPRERGQYLDKKRNRDTWRECAEEGKIKVEKKRKMILIRCHQKGASANPSA